MHVCSMLWGIGIRAPRQARPPITQTPPEIQRTGLAGVVLYLKSLPLDIDVLNFDYLDRPEVGR